MPATSLRRLLVPALVTIALAGGCGGDGNGGDSTSPTEWADSLCSSITTWTDSLRSSVQTLQGGNVTEESLRSAAGDVEDSTKTFVDDVKGLGEPDTEAGQRAKEELDGLADDLNDGADKIKSAADDVSGASGVLGAISTITGTLQMMSQQVSATFNQLGQLDPAGELEQGFQEADSCEPLRSSGG